MGGMMDYAEQERAVIAAFEKYPQLKQAWADRCGIDITDERCIYGWGKDCLNFILGWNAALSRPAPAGGMDEAIAEMEKCVKCLGRELHEAVHGDVVETWARLKEALSRLTPAAPVEKDRGEWQKPFVKKIMETAKITGEQAMTIMALVCDERERAYVQGSSNGFNGGYEYAKSKSSAHAPVDIDAMQKEPGKVVESQVLHPVDMDGKPNKLVTYCYQCGARVHGQKFCHGCGRRLKWTGVEEETIRIEAGRRLHSEQAEKKGE